MPGRGVAETWHQNDVPGICGVGRPLGLDKLGTFFEGTYTIKAANLPASGAGCSEMDFVIFSPLMHCALGGAKTASGGTREDIQIGPLALLVRAIWGRTLPPST